MTAATTLAEMPAWLFISLVGFALMITGGGAGSRTFYGLWIVVMAIGFGAGWWGK